MRLVGQCKYIYCTINKSTGTGMGHATCIIYLYYLLSIGPYHKLMKADPSGEIFYFPQEETRFKYKTEVRFLE